MSTKKEKKEIMAIKFTKDFARGIGVDNAPEWYHEACHGDVIFLNPDEDTFEIKTGYDDEGSSLLVKGGIGDWIVRCPKTGKINAIVEEGMRMFSDTGKTMLCMGDSFEEEDGVRNGEISGSKHLFKVVEVITGSGGEGYVKFDYNGIALNVDGEEVYRIDHDKCDKHSLAKMAEKLKEY